MILHPGLEGFFGFQLFTQPVAVVRIHLTQLCFYFHFLSLAAPQAAPNGKKKIYLKGVTLPGCRGDIVQENTD